MYGIIICSDCFAERLPHIPFGSNLSDMQVGKPPVECSRRFAHPVFGHSCHRTYAIRFESAALGDRHVHLSQHLGTIFSPFRQEEQDGLRPV